ncbi:mitochondrial carrier domain-containing protein [Thamnidium elegans]|nr:mitochondrial carrier domain-containing protein [Thamnidium elegans]
MSTVKVNPHRPYYTPGLHQHNYTSLPSNDSIPLLLEEKEHHAQLKGFTTRCTSFALLKYFVTMLTSPFEVGTTLLQVQYSPHQDVEVIGMPQEPTSIHHFDSEEEDEEDEFFKRPERTSIDNVRIRTDNLLSVSVYDEKNRPMHQMAPMEGGGVLEILNLIMKQPTEGWKALFKGQRVTWIYEMLRTVLRPGLESSLNDIFGLYDDTIPLLHLDSVTPNISTIVVSHLVIGLLLSPLEIIRTRLVVQSSSPLCSKYNGPVHALRTMFHEEGGLKGVYFHSKNLFPTLLYHTITPLLSCSTPLIIARLFHIFPADSPILYGAAELALSTLGLVVMLPIETIRKRLQSQVQGDFKSAVALRPAPYRGFFDALYKIMKEEGTRNKRSVEKKTRKQKRLADSSSESDSDSDLFPAKTRPTGTPSAWGIRGLYRGFSMQLMANVMVFVFHTMNGIEDGFNGII